MNGWVNIIDRWPSIRDLAADLNVGEDAVRKWRQRNNIPAEYWSDMSKAAGKRGILLSTDEMLELGAEKRR